MITVVYLKVKNEGGYVGERECSHVCRVDAMVQLIEALRYKPEERGFDSRWRHWKFSLT